jgi:hypothetical protein
MKRTKRNKNTDQCCQWKIIKEVCEDLPDTGIAIPAINM